MKCNPAPLPEPEIIDVEAIFRDWKAGRIEMVVVLGPTASGKTRYAVDLCRQFNALAGESVAEIISAGRIAKSSFSKYGEAYCRETFPARTA